jgi:hypothetical protein
MQPNYEELEPCDNDAQPLYREDLEFSKLLGDSFEEVIIAGKAYGQVWATKISRLKAKAVYI